MSNTARACRPAVAWLQRQRTHVAGSNGSVADSYHLIAWDMRGHDRSDSPDNPSLYSHEATIADMAAVLDACGAARAIIAACRSAASCHWRFISRIPRARKR